MNNVPGILRKLFALLLVCMLLQSCSIPSATTPSPAAATAENTSAIPAATGSQAANATAIALVSTGIPTPVPGPLDWLLALRSVKINLHTAYPDGSVYSFAIVIDNAGNMRVTEKRPVVMYTKDMPDPKAVDTSKFSGTETLYVINGKAYEADSSDPGWKTNPVDDDYAQTLVDIFNGPDGPGLWLDILTDDAFTASGNEKVGGFDTDKYTVNGQFNGQTISGTAWFDTKTRALIKADLSVPVVLVDSSQQNGMVKITLEAQKATIEPVKLPDLSIPKDTPTPTP